MAYLPQLNIIQTSSLMTTGFLGLNRALAIGEGEMADMTNMTGDQYPVLATRKHRTLVSWTTQEDGGKRTFSYPQGIIGTEKLVICDNGKVYIDGAAVEGLTLSTDPAMQPKHLVTMGAYVCIWPDKIYLNLATPDDHGAMGRTWAAQDEDAITAVMCRKDGRVYEDGSIAIASSAPQEPQDQQLWLDTSGEKDVLKQYSSVYQQWITVATTYIKISAPGIGRGLTVNDVPYMTGLRAAPKNEIEEPEVSSGSLNIPLQDFWLKSTWTTAMDGTRCYHTTPTVDERIVKADTSGIPKDAKLIGARLHYSYGSPRSGISMLTVNGVTITGNSIGSIPVTVTPDGAITARFRFQALGDASPADLGDHAGSLAFSNLTVQIDYEAVAPSAAINDNEETASLIKTKDDEQIEALNSTCIIYGCEEDYIIVSGLLREARTLMPTASWEQRVPDFDYVCEANNRIWGCCYATVDGELRNELHACALGDFRNWESYHGTSMDSYVVSVGTDGRFTGAYSIKGVPVFFKEQCMHRVSGTQPNNFTLATQMCRGVQDGCWRSLCMVGETLYYRARTDVMAYDGSLPYSISDKLGPERFTDAAAGCFRDKLYMSMRDTAMRWHLYVYDVSKKLWHREDDSCVRFFATVHGDMYFIRETAAASQLMSVNGLTEAGEEGLFEWSATFGVYGYAYATSKYLSRFNIRAQLAAGGWMRMEIQYDSNGEWVDHGTMRCTRLRTFLLPVIPRRCDHCQIRLTGYGDAKIYSIERILEHGGDG